MKKSFILFVLALCSITAFAQTQDWTTTDPNYDAPDVGVVTYNALNHGVVADGITDNTTVVQNLLNSISAQGGGVLYFPAGNYNLKRLSLPKGVSIRGDWKKPTEGHSYDGTLLMCSWGKNSTSTNEAFITMEPSTSVSNVAIWYPEQDANAITKFPATIVFGKSGYWGNEYCHVRNVTFINSYHAILHRGQSGGGATNVHNVYGTVLNRGIEIDNVSEVCRFDYIHWSPKYWVESGLAGAPTSATSGAYIDFMKANAIGVEMKRNDWSYTSFLEAEGLKIGFHAVKSAFADPAGSTNYPTPNGHNYGFIFKNCGTGVQCDNISSYGIMFTNVNTENCQRGIVVNSTDNGPVQVSSCTFAADTAVFVTKSARSRLMMYQTTVNSGKVVIQNSDFTSVDGDYNNAIPQIELSKDSRAIITGNRSNGVEMQNSNIKNGSFYECNIDNTPIVGMKTPPVFTWEDCFDVPTKPAKNDLFNVLNYGAEPFRVLPNGTYVLIDKPFDSENADTLSISDNGTAARRIIRCAYKQVIYGDTTGLQAALNVWDGNKEAMLNTVIALAETPDATTAIQDALDAAYSNGGGIVYLPAGHYKVLGHLTIPEGVEMKGANDVGTHPMGVGTVLLAFENKDNESGTPFITMGANSGIRGITIDYPEQDAFETEDFRHTYPYSIRGNANTYIVNIALHASYQGIDLFTNKCDNHFIDYLAGQPFKNTVVVGGNSIGGRIYNIQTNLISYVSGNENKFGTWINSPLRDGGTITDNIKSAVSYYLAENHTFLTLGDCSEEILYNNFGYKAKHGIWFKDEGNGPSGKCLGQGVDAGIVSLYYEKLGTGGFDMVNSQIVVVQDGSQANKDGSAYIETASTFTGEANLFSSDYWGNPKVGIIAGGGTLNLYTAHSNALLKSLQIAGGNINLINSNIGNLNINNAATNAANVGVSYSFVRMASGTNESSYAQWVYNLDPTIKNPSSNPPIKDRTGWIAYASENDGVEAQKSIDNSTSTYWISSTLQTSSHWYYVDMQTPNKFNIIYISSGTSSNYINRFDVLISNDGENWNTIASSILGSKQIVLQLPYTYEAQYIKIQSKSTSAYKWSIYNFGIAEEDGIPDYIPNGILENQEDKEKISVYYKNGTLQISNIENKEYQLALFNIVGQQITNRTATSNNLNIGELKTGIYILTIKQNNKYFSGKFFAK